MTMEKAQDKNFRQFENENDISSKSMDDIASSFPAEVEKEGAVEAKFHGKSKGKYRALKMIIWLLCTSLLVVGAIMLTYFINIQPVDEVIEETKAMTNVSEANTWSYVNIESYEEALKLLGNGEELAEQKESFPRMIELQNYGLIYEGLFAPNLDLIKKNHLNIPKEDTVSLLMLRMYLHNDNQLQIKILDPLNKRYEIPEAYPYPYAGAETDASIISKTQRNMPSVDIEIDLRGETFFVEVKRKGTDDIIMRLNQKIIFSNYYSTFELELSSKQLYGFGERTSRLQYEPGTYTLYMLDRGAEIDKGKPGNNKHGHHPMYLNKEASGKFNLLYFRNSNSQELTITETNKIKWRTIGGIIDLNLFIGDENPEALVDTYHRFIGGWSIPALWHLGYHQSKWRGYPNVQAIEEAITHYNNENIPLDVMWSDVEYMKISTNLIMNEEVYDVKEMQAMFKRTKKRWIPIVDAVVPMDDSYKLETRADYKDFVIRDNDNVNLCAGTYLNASSHFLDFMHPKISDFWEFALDNIYNKVNFAGLWLDSNEITSSDTPDSERVRAISKVAHNKYRNIPFLPGGESLYELRALNFECLHYDGSEEYNVRPFNSLKQTQVTHKYLSKKSPFPFILSRGTLVGGSKFAYHWIPDMKSEWPYLKDSFGALMSSGLFGYTMVGTEICGFIGWHQTDPELCLRWHHVGMFNTFLRNHHIPTYDTFNSQEPYAFEGVYKAGIIKAIRLRYYLLKWIYSIYFEKGFISNEASGFMSKGIGMILKPLFFKFHNAEDLPEYGSDVIEFQFMVGDHVMAAPVFTKKTYVQDTYFVKGVWTDLRDLSVIKSKGEFIEIDSKVEQDVPYFLYEGGMIFFNEDDKALNSEELDNELKFVFSLNSTGQSAGGFLNINNYKEENVATKCVNSQCYVQFNAELTKSDDGSRKICLNFNDKNNNKVAIDQELLVDKIVLITGYEQISESNKMTLEGENVVELGKYGTNAAIQGNNDGVEIQGIEAFPLYLLDNVCVTISV